MWLLTLLDRWYFLLNLRHIVKAELSRSTSSAPTHEVSPFVGHIRETLARFKQEIGPNKSKDRPDSHSAHKKRGSHQRDTRNAPLRPEMVRRLDIAPHPINPMGSRATTFSSGAVDGSGVDFFRPAPSRRSLLSSTNPPQTAPTGEDEFGGFPGPQAIINRALTEISPRFQRRLKRTLTVPRTETLIPREGGAVIAPDGPVKPVPYLSFSAIVRQSTFHGLTQENIEELGGVEYRALTALMWIIPLV